LNYGEFVPAEAGDRIHFADARSHSPRDFAEQQVSRGVAERIVHGLEVIEIDAQDCQAALIPSSPCQCLLEAIFQQHPVRQMGERVMLRQKTDLPLRFDLARDVPSDAAIADECAGFIKNRPSAHFGNPPLPL
jgi:hypothetical protein